jgi:hypothetical protein
MDFFGGPSGTSPTTGSPAATASPLTLPSRADVKTQEQLMQESIHAITERGRAKYDELQEALRKRTGDADAKAFDEEEKTKRAAQAELKQHVESVAAATAAAKKTHAEAQAQLLKESKVLEAKAGAVWELAATHCDLSKPNTRSQKNTDRMRKLLSTLDTEPNVPIGASKQ